MSNEKKTMFDMAKEKFAKDHAFLQGEMDKVKDDSTAVLKWTFIWQETWMWIRMGHCADFDWLCDRRGFDSVQRQYLRDMMEHIGLWGKPEPKVNPRNISRARRIFVSAFKADPDFKQGYIANVAMLLYDRGWLKRPNEDMNEAAEAVLDLIFEDKR